MDLPRPQNRYYQRSGEWNHQVQGESRTVPEGQDQKVKPQSAKDNLPQRVEDPSSTALCTKERRRVRAGEPRRRDGRSGAGRPDAKRNSVAIGTDEARKADLEEILGEGTKEDETPATEEEHLAEQEQDEEITLLREEDEGEPEAEEIDAEQPKRTSFVPLKESIKRIQKDGYVIVPRKIERISQITAKMNSGA